MRSMTVRIWPMPSAAADLGEGLLIVGDLDERAIEAVGVELLRVRGMDRGDHVATGFQGAVGIGLHGAAKVSRTTSMPRTMFSNEMV